MTLGRSGRLAEAVTIYCVCLRAASRAIAAVAILAMIAPAIAQDISPYKVADGLAVYLGVIPAELISGHPGSHAEAEMQEVPLGRHVHHVAVAVFDNVAEANNRCCCLAESWPWSRRYRKDTGP
jgi:hypothetical protein